MLQSENDLDAVIVAESQGVPRGRPTTITPRDIAWLRVIRDATWITKEHLLALIVGEHALTNVRDINRQIQRLKNLRLVQEMTVVVFNTRVFGIAPLGIRTLNNHGYGLASVSEEAELLQNPSQIGHYSGLNEARIVLTRMLNIGYWMGDRELASHNIGTNTPTAKDYDSVFVVNATQGQKWFGVEYEHTTKSRDRYRDIRSSLQKEDQLSALFYLVDTMPFAVRLAQHVSVPNMLVGFLLLAELRTRREHCKVHYVNSNHELTSVDFGALMANLLQ